LVLGYLYSVLDIRDGNKIARFYVLNLAGLQNCRTTLAATHAPNEPDFLGIGTVMDGCINVGAHVVGKVTVSRVINALSGKSSGRSLRVSGGVWQNFVPPLHQKTFSTLKVI
jgi:hypothetical protein